MKEFHLQLDIPPGELLRYYDGRAQDVIATANDGTRVRFPARVLREHVNAAGVSGRFLLRCDVHYRFVSLERL